MVTKEEFCLFTFASTHHAILAEKCLTGTVEVKIIPVPRQISVSCGLAIRFECHEKDLVQEILLEHNIPISKRFHCIRHDKTLEIIES